MVACEEFLGVGGVVLEIAVVGRDYAAGMIGEEVVGQTQADVVRLPVILVAVVVVEHHVCRYSCDGYDGDQQDSDDFFVHGEST